MSIYSIFLLLRPRLFVYSLHKQIRREQKEKIYNNCFSEKLTTLSMCVQLILINIMLSQKIKFTNQLVYPQSRESISRKREELGQYNRELISKQSMRSSKRLTSTAPYTFSSSGKRFLQTALEKRINLPLQLQSRHLQSRPFTQQTYRQFYNKSNSPLSVIKDRQKIGRNNKCFRMFRSSSNLRYNFLKKGSSIDKTIISNVLKSKANSNVIPSAFSYSDCPANQQILKVVAKQIPKGIKDVVGPQQMIRMSHILTGVPFKAVSLTQRLNIMARQHPSYRNNMEQQDHMTLKSIKRW